MFRLNHDAPHLDRLSTLLIQINHTMVLYWVEQFFSQHQHQKMILKLQGVDDPKAVYFLQGCSILVPQEMLPQLSPQEA